MADVPRGPRLKDADEPMPITFGRFFWQLGLLVWKCLYENGREIVRVLRG